MNMLQAGDIIELKEGHKVYAQVPEHFLYQNRKGCFELARGVVTIGGELAYLAGKYVVTQTTYDGGGSGMDPHDVYPDGHHVYCQRLEDRVEVDFYQSGCFSAMITDIEPVGKAVLQWAVAPGSS